MGEGAAPRALVAGNWKMNGVKASFTEIRLLCTMLQGVKLDCDVMICPPATLIHQMCERIGDDLIRVGGQDCHHKSSGAHTGDISADMLRDAGASAVIVGHSERRQDHGETSDLVANKAKAAHSAGLTAIICIGETLEQREKGLTLAVIEDQLHQSLPDQSRAANTIIAYEPVWAIGSGLTPSSEQVAEVHAAMRNQLLTALPGEGEMIRLLYGGSVKPANAQELMAIDNVNGALVGGASLKASDFIGIIKTYGG